MCEPGGSRAAQRRSDLNRETIPVLLGPTATGKTALLERLARSYPIEVISCDSRQVYEGMPVGTAQPDADELARTPHHLIGFLSPAERYSAGEFRKACNTLIPQIRQRGHIPVISGGTGFYFRALYTEMIDIVDDEELRTTVHNMSHEERLAMLQARDPESLCRPGAQPAAGRVHPNDVYRVERALYILLLTGRPLRSFYETGFRKRSDMHFEGVCLDLPPDVWKEKVRDRALQMLDQGLVDEAVTVRRRYGDCPALRTPGYSEALQFAAGEINRHELHERLTRSHLQYGRRQRVWFRREEDLLPVTGSDAALHILEKLLRAGIRS